MSMPVVNVNVVGGLSNPVTQFFNLGFHLCVCDLWRLKPKQSQNAARMALSPGRAQSVFPDPVHGD
jgi:hypothetical protein